MNKYDRTAGMDRLHALNRVYRDLTGTDAFQYSNAPTGGTEYFHFSVPSGSAEEEKVSGLDAALTHMQSLIDARRADGLRLHDCDGHLKCSGFNQWETA